MLKAIYAEKSRDESIKKAERVCVKLEETILKDVAKNLRNVLLETLSYTYFLNEHWMRIRTNNLLERLIKEIKRRTKVVGCFPDSQSALILAATR